MGMVTLFNFLFKHIWDFMSHLVEVIFFLSYLRRRILIIKFRRRRKLIVLQSLLLLAFKL